MKPAANSGPTPLPTRPNLTPSAYATSPNPPSHYPSSFSRHHLPTPPPPAAAAPHTTRYRAITSLASPCAPLLLYSCTRL